MDCGSNSKFRRALPLALAGSGAVALLAFGGATFAGSPAGVVRTIVAPDSAPITGTAQPEAPAAPAGVASEAAESAAAPANINDRVPATAPQQTRASAQDLPAVTPAQREAGQDLPLVGGLGGVTSALGPVTGALGSSPVGGLAGGLPTGALPTGGVPQVKTPDLSQVNPNIANLPLGGVANAKLPQTSGGAPGLVP